MTDEQLDNKLTRLKATLIRKYWSPLLETPWNTVEVLKYHRTVSKSVRNIFDVKSLISDSVGTLGPFIFLNDFWSKHDWSGPYRNTEKGLLIIYQLLTGKTFAEMKPCIPQSTFQALHKEVFIKNQAKLEKWIDEKITTMFSSPAIRVCSALLNNPEEFKCVTLYADGHDARINYSSQYETEGFKHSSFYSYKLKESGLCTQVMMDINGMFLLVSSSEPCAINNDGSMFVAWKPQRAIARTDVLQLDGGYTLFVIKLLKQQDVADEFNTSNFVFPLRKITNIDFKLGETEYINRFGAKRSHIETGFADVGSVFKTFSCNKKLKVHKDIYNLKLKLSLFFMNVRRAEREFLPLHITSTHRAWLNDDFDFQTSDESIKTISIRVEEQHAQVSEMTSIQESFISQIFALDSDEDESDQIDDFFYDLEQDNKQQQREQRRQEEEQRRQEEENEEEEEEQQEEESEYNDVNLQRLNRLIQIRKSPKKGR